MRRPGPRGVAVVEELVERMQARQRKAAPFLGRSEEEIALRFHRLQRMRLRLESLSSQALTLGRRIRVVSTACWEFPIYSQTFVYQELSEIARRGFADHHH